LADCSSAGIWGQGRPTEAGDIILNNDCTRCGCGIYSFWAKEITGNNFSGCGTALGFYGYGNDWDLNLAIAVTQNTYTGASAGLNINPLVSGTSITDLDCRGMGIENQIMNIGSWGLFPNNITLARIQFSASAIWALCCSGFQNSLIDDITVTGDGQEGLHFADCSGVTVRNCNSSGRRTGIYFHYINPDANTGGNKAENCVLTDCPSAGIWGQGRPTEAGDIVLNNDCSRCGCGIYSFWAAEISDNTLEACGIGLNLPIPSGVNVFHNNIFNCKNRNVYSEEPIELSYNGQGNYWGHSCEDPALFIPCVDSNSPEVMDSHPYGLLNGWLNPQVTPGCPPIKNLPPTVEAGGPYSVEEGSSIQVTATGSDPDNDPITFA